MSFSVSGILIPMMLQQKKNTTRRIIISIVVLLIIAGAGIAGVYYWNMLRNKAVGSYDECVAAGNPIHESSPESCSTPDGKHYINQHTEVSLEGTAVCLPHKNTEGLQTLECAVGIKTADGTFYGVSGDTSNVLAKNTGTNKKVRITGKIEPSTDTIYNITQLIAVTKIELI